MSSPDAHIAAVAAHQDGVVSTGQLLDAGLDRHGINQRARTGRLHRLHHGVYAVGHRSVTRRGRIRAATLGTGGVASHRSAGVLWDLLPAHEGELEHVTRRTKSGRRDIIVHQSALSARDRTERHGIPVTTIERLCLDLAETEPLEVVARVIGQAEVDRRITRRALHARLPQWHGRRGVKVLAAILDGDLESAPTRSVLEDRFLALVRRARLPRPRLNERVEGKEVDAHWPREQVIVELDGRRWHDAPGRVEADRRRDAGLAAAGWVVLRFSHRRITREPEAVAAELAAVLALRSVQAA